FICQWMEIIGNRENRIKTLVPPFDPRTKDPVQKKLLEQWIRLYVHPETPINIAAEGLEILKGYLGPASMMDEIDRISSKIGSENILGKRKRSSLEGEASNQDGDDSETSETGEGGEAGETDETEEVFSGEELELEDNVEEKKDQELKKNARKKLKKMDFSDSSSSSSESEPERVPEPKPKPKPNPKTKMVELKKQKKSEQAGKKSGREYKDWVAEEFMELIPGLATGDNIQKRKL